MAGTAVLYLAPIAGTFDELRASAGRVSWLSIHRDGDRIDWVGAGTEITFDVVTSAAEAAARTRAEYYALAVVDCRQLAGFSAAQIERQERELHDFLERLRAEPDPDRRFPFERVVLLLGGPDVDHTDRLMFDAGSHHVGMCLRDKSLVPGASETDARRARSELLHHVWDLAHTVVAGRKVGVTALCAAGGGITGIYYELGVLKCLQDALGTGRFGVDSFDMYFGISAGAIVTSLLANGMSIEEAVRGFGGDFGDDLDVQLKLRHLNVRDIPRRVGATAAHLRAYARRVRLRKEPFNLAGVGWHLATLLGPVFDTARIERRFSRFLDQDGRTNDFRALDRKLYIGATDQDVREHVLFGDEPFRHVPISKAVQASSAIHPFFRSVEIDGRYYTDGFVTRTSNIKAAIDKGANLIFVIDPFLPLVSHTPGVNARHGLLWGILQDYKTVAFTRFQRVSEHLLRRNPHVTCFTFVPSNRMRRLMATNPMAASYFDVIVCEAYRSTYRRFRRLEHRLGPRLEEHGMRLDLSGVAATIERLDRIGRPRARALVDEGLGAARPQRSRILRRAA